MNTFLVADPHFCHEKAVRFREDSQFDNWRDMNEYMIERWNQTVTNADRVIVLGDFALCGGQDEKIEALDDVVHRLNGRLELVMGNHDRDFRIAQYFDRIDGAREFKGCILTHIPVHPSQFARFKVNIHGHLHTDQIIQEPRLIWGEEWDEFNKRYNKIPLAAEADPDPRYLCVSMEQVDYTPICWEEVCLRVRDRKVKYGE